jgi:hypothetical protein
MFNVGYLDDWEEATDWEQSAASRPIAPIKQMKLRMGKPMGTPSA